MGWIFRFLVLWGFCGGAAVAWAEPFPILPDSSLVGALRSVAARASSTLPDIARRYSLGYDQIIKANPGMNRWVPGEGTPVLLPALYILPDAPRKGIVLNLAELRLYFYPDSPSYRDPKGAALRVLTYPVSIGRMDWKTPLGITKVARKDRDPAWYPPESIRREHAAEGDPLPKMVPGGIPENPLGRFALRLALPLYLIHGTDARKSFGIGMRVTHGCVRMYPEDIEDLFGRVRVGTKVTILDEPVKVGWDGSTLFLEVHKLLEEERETTSFENSLLLNAAFRKLKKEGAIELDRARIAKVVKLGNGIPTVVGRRAMPDRATPRMSNSSF